MATAKDNGSIIWEALTKNGFTEYATAGIMGNLKAESNLDPKILQGGGHSDNIVIDGVTGYGLAQWTYITRQEKLADFAKAKGKISGDLMVQIDFLIEEIGQYGLVNKLNSYTSAYDAAIMFHREFENSADTPEQEARRGVYAEEIYKSKGVGAAEATYSGDYVTYQFGQTKLQGVVGGMAAPANASPTVADTPPHGKDHNDTVFENPSKTYCEPVYPDLVSIKDQVPVYEVTDVAANAAESELILTSNMFYEIPTSTLTKYGSADVAASTAANVAIEEQRKTAFDAEQHKNAFKVPSSGKPANNNDPFPFDSKIEELELHQPRCKIDSIRTCPEAVNVTRACMQLSTDVERRLVRLENNMATILRYLGRMSGRIAVNCVYYGGQTPSYEKYKCIRCLKDNRISDGQLMSIDQCLNCTRYEPLIGQVYDILNDQGLNLSQILDDCQMSYTTMSEYCDFVKSTKYQKDLETTTLNVNGINIRSADEKDFSQTWSPGVKMDWSLFPVEDQVPHINKTQNINGDTAGQLSSYYGTATNWGSMYSANSVFGDRMTQNKNMMEEIISSESESN